MAGQYKTRCPHCGAQFKISDEHLDQAQGAVRCGSCLQIFQATDHMIGAAPAPAPDQWQYALDMDTEPADHTPPARGEPGDDLGELDLSGSFLSLEQGGHDHDEAFSQLDGDREALSGNADESWAEALLEDLDDEREPPVTAPPRPASPARTTPAPPHDDTFDFLNATPAAPRHAHHEPPTARGALSRTLIWMPLALLAALVLVGQYAFFHFDTLARTPQWRPLYAQACEVIGCPLPALSDLRYLRGANLVVRSHPRYRNALMVDALLFNEGQWPQPFPALELTFSDLDGQPVASRRFQPREYLRGDLAALRTLPVDTPVHVALEIVDPGARAVSYHLRLVPPATGANLARQGGL
jgi:predicted Zn finger-like uncharacterized protein